MKLEILKTLKEYDQDFEWYPTTDKMIDTIKKHLEKNNISIQETLDIGAGDGRVLEKFSKDLSSAYAIEKSKILAETMNKDILIIGDDFYNTSLIDKEFDLIFSNPPYSEFQEWVCKILREANTKYIALIIPSRWINDESIKRTINNRKGLSYEILDQDDFLDAPRQARAKVDVVFFTTQKAKHEKSWNEEDEDIFSNILTETFNLKKIFNDNEDSKRQYKYGLTYVSEEVARLHEDMENVKEEDLINFLTQKYQEEYEDFVNSLNSLHAINPKLLKALNIDKKVLVKGIKKQLRDLKNLYWEELFNKLDSITSRLTSKYRRYLTSDIISQKGIDFTKPNIYNVVLWVIKNANRYIECSYLDLFERMAVSNTPITYKSNERFKTDEWRYTFEKYKNTPHKLDYRIVLPYMIRSYSYVDKEFLSDLRIVARNLGFTCLNYIESFCVGAGETRMHFVTPKSSYDCLFFQYKGYKNGNVHIKFNQEFMASLNIAVGKLNNWLKNKQEAKEEFQNINEEILQNLFDKPLGLIASEELARLTLQN